MKPFHLFTILALWLQTSRSLAEIHHAQGEMSGEVTATSVRLQSRLTALPGPELDAKGDIPGTAGMAYFEWSTSPDFSDASRTKWLWAKPEHDFIVQSSAKGLNPGTKYYYRLVFGESRDNVRKGPTRQFRTLPESGPLTFCMGSCMNYHAFMSGKPNGGGPVTATDEDKRLGFRVFESMAKLEPDFFIGTGDIVYYDIPYSDPAETLPDLRKKWHEQFRFPRLVEFFGRTPAYWSKDDHDFRYNDADLTKSKLPSVQTGIDLFREQLPIVSRGAPASPTYRTHRVHNHLQLWFVEGRDHRSPNKMPDGPDKSIWGREQRDWLQSTLKASDAKWKVIITPTPMVGPDRNSKTDNHANLAGFKHEADSFFQWLVDEDVGGVLAFCGDRHWQYHSIHPLGVEEFAVGALNDENSIMGTLPGTPKSTDPEGLIEQPYHYEEPTGGFLHVTINDDAQLVLTHHDDHGTVLNRVIR